jgi:malonyl-CoA O-methyltransferase
LRNEQGEIALTFEIIYGHAMKPVPKVKVSSQSSVSLEQMRRMLASGQAKAN